MAYDIFFISYDEENADENFSKIKQEIPYVRRIHGIHGIKNAHMECARQTKTNNFWTIDGDNQLTNIADFSYKPSVEDRNYIHVWRAKNPINGLIYGYGGIKLWPKKILIDNDSPYVDMTTSLGLIKIVNSCWSITCFNSSPFSAWKSAFRETVKLSSKIIKNQNSQETENRLHTWLTVFNLNEPFTEYVKLGAEQGSEYGTNCRNNPSELMKINSWNWLKEKFNEITVK